MFKFTVFNSDACVSVRVFPEAVVAVAEAIAITRAVIGFSERNAVQLTVTTRATARPGFVFVTVSGDDAVFSAAAARDFLNMIRTWSPGTTVIDIVQGGVTMSHEYYSLLPAPPAVVNPAGDDMFPVLHFIA